MRKVWIKIFPTTPPQAPETGAPLSRAVVSLCALLLLAAFYEVARRGLLIWGGQFEVNFVLVTFGLVTALCVALPWLSGTRKRIVLLAASVLVGAAIVRWLLLFPLFLAWLTTRVSRTRWSTPAKLTVVLGVWLLVPVITWFIPRGWGRFDELSMYWAMLFGPLICLVVERSRGQLEEVGVFDEWLYLLVFPRFFVPFPQPIGVRRFHDSWRGPADVRLALRALALGVYGLGGYFVIRYTFYALKSPTAPLSLVNHGPQILTNGLRIYAFNATSIFCAVALLRLVGYDLGSGFRYPLLATSFADLYRRWNYYLFEFSSSMFYLPLVTRLRRFMPLSLAYVLAGYASVLVGVWGLFNVFGLWPFGQYGVQMWLSMRDVKGLSGYFLVWTVIVVPQVLFAPVRRLRRFLWWRIGGRLITIGTGVGLATYAFIHGITVY
ncbi:MAG TPA: hypothetical protein VHB79_39565 [Polyangiaceae bacterium]|nr:hypothetical protein [Polyangiaceae bacterium]